MVHSDDLLLVPPTNELAHDQPTGYLLIALHKGMNHTLSHLNAYGLLKTQYVQAHPVLQPTPDGS